MYSNSSFICAIFVCLIAFLGCNTTKFTPDNLPETQLIFGSGGGYSGLVNQYIILENGQLFEKKGDDKTFSEINKIKKKKAHTLYTQLENIAFTEMEVNQPGNIYRFIHLVSSGVDHQLTWGKGDYQVDAQVESLYQELLALVKKDK